MSHRATMIPEVFIPDRTCPDCAGTGEGECPTCEGANEYRTRDGRIVTPCWRCKGSTPVDCGTCSGVGEVPCHCGIDAPAVTTDGCCEDCSAYPHDDPCPRRRQP